jgi:hypothetical protein
MLITKTPPHTCPECKKPLNAVASPFEDRKPQVGDLTVCINCATALILEPGLTLRVLTIDEMKALSPAELFELVHAQTMIREAHRQRRRSNYPNN